ncbi:MAG: hypothetical protein AAGA92_14095 [Planctomycetota bacterium]
MLRLDKLDIALDLRELNRRREVQKRRVLYRMGRYGQQVLRRLIRRGKKASKPGQPPRARTKKNGVKSNFKKLARFFVNADDGSVSVGLMDAKFQGTRPDGGKTVAQLLNEGGPAKINDAAVPARFRPRPFTDPTLDKAGPRLVEIVGSVEL